MEMHNLLQFFREQMEILSRIPYTLERNGIPFVRECTVERQREREKRLVTLDQT